MSRVVGFVVLCTVFTVTALTDPSPCNQGDNELCLETVKNYLYSSDWWFGDSYQSECPEEVRETRYECYNPDPDRTVVGERIFQRHDFNVDSITQFLRMRYSVEGGTYIACGHRFTVEPLHMSQDVDSTNTLYYDSWTTTHRPAIVWVHTPGKRYTLLAYNVGLMELDGLWLNIVGGDSAQGVEIHPYVGPMNPFARTTLQSFILFEQSAAIDDKRYDLIRKEIDRYKGENENVYRLDHLMAIVPEIRDPLALGYLSVSASPFAIEYHRSMNNINNCPWLIHSLVPMATDIVSALGIADVDQLLRHLQFDLVVEFRSDAFNYTACCETRYEDKRIVKVDPLSTESLSPFHLRKEPWVKLDGAIASDNHLFSYGTYYSLFLLDVTPTLDPIVPNNPTLLWHVANIEKPYPSDSGDVMSEYVMPLPVFDSNETNVFVFLVFNQGSGMMANTSLDRYCSGNYVSGCKLDLQMLVSEHELTLNGFNMFTIDKVDLYSRMVMYESNKVNKSEACRGVPMYSEPCPEPEPCEPTTPAPTTTADPTTTWAENTTAVGVNGTNEATETTATDATATPTTETTVREDTTKTETTTTTTTATTTEDNTNYDGAATITVNPLLLFAMAFLFFAREIKLVPA